MQSNLAAKKFSLAENGLNKTYYPKLDYKNIMQSNFAAKVYIDHKNLMQSNTVAKDLMQSNTAAKVFLVAMNISTGSKISLQPTSSSAMTTLLNRSVRLRRQPRHLKL